MIPHRRAEELALIAQEIGAEVIRWGPAVVGDSLTAFDTCAASQW